MLFAYLKFYTEVYVNPILIGYIVTIVLLVGLNIFQFWKNRPLRNKYDELKTTYGWLRDQYRTTERIAQEYRIIFNRMENTNPSKVTKLLVDIHDAYMSYGDEKRFKELMRQIGELKCGSMKNLPKVEEYNGGR